ncbi:OB-fold-containig protein [Sandaracinus amylolyticus]|uniref:OB-fold-containig protein n=1 Tax=Sandaracinus amylolyticus TaxID=927083 RepID=UPI001F26B55B|nr:OB-fold-containig protein [Sandaracinus amylolyticus]UJR85143.1 Hypothetical protein I5071_72230 [Sandaracinus amylolyticus]
MSVLDWLSSWANVPFTVAGGATLLFALVQATGVLGLLGGHDDGDADGHAEGDGDGDADGHADAGHGSALEALLGPLAIGRVPLTLTVESAGLAFAIAGLSINSTYLDHPAGPPLVSLAWTLPIALLVGYGGAALVARVLAPIVDDRAQAATSRRELVGTIGVVISSRVSAEFGEVRLRDRSGHDVRVVCRVAPGTRELAERDEAVVVECSDDGTLYVAAFDEGEPERRQRVL